VADIIKGLWAGVVAAATDALASEMSSHGPGDPHDYIEWGQFGSPIESAMFFALVSNAHDQFITTRLMSPQLTLESPRVRPATVIDDHYVVGHNFCTNSRDTERRVYPQCNVGKYRVDFLVEQGWADVRHVVVVECDGHDFHEKTKEQARRDKARDRYMQTFGLSVLRFAGSEIHRDPHACASQVQEFFEARDHEQFLVDEAEFNARRGKK